MLSAKIDYVENFRNSSKEHPSSSAVNNVDRYNLQRNNTGCIIYLKYIKRHHKQYQSWLPHCY